MHNQFYDESREYYGKEKESKESCKEAPLIHPAPPVVDADGSWSSPVYCYAGYPLEGKTADSSAVFPFCAIVWYYVHANVFTQQALRRPGRKSP